MLRVSSCFGCISLKTGTLVLGWMSVIGSVLNVLAMASEIGQVDDMDTVIRELNEDCDDDCIELMHNMRLGIGIGAIFVNSIVIVVASLLIHGVNKGRASFMTPYIVYMTGSVVLLCVATLVIAIFLAAIPIAVIVFLFIMLFCIGLTGYFTLVVKSYQTELLESRGATAIRLEESDYKPPTYADQQAGAFTDQPMAYGGKPAGYGQSPVPYGAQPDAYGAQPGPYGGQPMPYTDQPPAYGDNPPAYGFKS